MYISIAREPPQDKRVIDRGFAVKHLAEKNVGEGIVFLKL